MRRVLCPVLPKVGQRIEIDPAEAKHLTTVLRIREDETVELLDGNGQKSQARIIFQEKRLFLEGITIPDSNPKLNALPLHLKIAILKGDAMEWVIEKSVELGVKSLCPIYTDYTVVQVQKKGADAFVERWQKIANQALKQCGRLERLQILAPQGLEETFASSAGLTFWLDENLASDGSSTDHLLASLESLIQIQRFSLPISVLVGPEGGFSPQERERLLQLTALHNKEINMPIIKRVHLGPLVLRAETAALMAISLMAGKLYGTTTQNQNSI